MGKKTLAEKISIRPQAHKKLDLQTITEFILEYYRIHHSSKTKPFQEIAHITKITDYLEGINTLEANRQFILGFIHGADLYSLCRIPEDIYVAKQKMRELINERLALSKTKLRTFSIDDTNMSMLVDIFTMEYFDILYDLKADPKEEKRMLRRIKRYIKEITSSEIVQKFVIGILHGAYTFKKVITLNDTDSAKKEIMKWIKARVRDAE